MFSFLAKNRFVVNGLRNLSTKASPGTEFSTPRIPDNAKCINKVILLGRCTSDAQLKPINNTHYTSFIIVTNDIRKTKSNEIVKRSDFHKVFVYQPFLAKKAHDLITKGTRVYLEGKLNYRRVENTFFSNVVAEKLIFVSGTNQSYAEGDEDYAEIEEVDETFVEDGGSEKSQVQSN
ncbi:PREDICTED: single-stranded DNA-binding protein, mitochondrial-like [Rhagoletis zephyria]|uniref:single-stranded DNA-binding protein, mitochondrial-like n=1 Tax=Rhagoletis zephyria TaxID=28612 RepID=UPI0008114964|nr:PREDICTED: single-stranded DNA-binding protein, mitochondrial-like [Rhagoletis zephyria]